MASESGLLLNKVVTYIYHVYVGTRPLRVANAEWGVYGWSPTSVVSPPRPYHPLPPSMSKSRPEGVFHISCTYISSVCL